jgi:hypothetical protein
MSHLRRLRPILLSAVTLAVLAGALAWSLRSRSTRYATPADCLEAYRAASLAGDAARFRGCLGEPLRSEVQRSYADDHSLADALRRDTTGIKNWVDLGPPEVHGDGAVAVVDEVRATGQRRLRFHLERSGSGWLIARVEKEDERAPEVRYGTRLGEDDR